MSGTFNGALRDVLAQEVLQSLQLSSKSSLISGGFVNDSPVGTTKGGVLINDKDGIKLARGNFPLENQLHERSTT